MASPPTSRLSFLAPDGTPIAAPTEWEPAWLALDVPLEPWREPRVTANGQPLEVQRRRLGDRERALVAWDRANAGHYRIALEHPGVADRRTIRVLPRKLTPESHEAMLMELERDLPAAIALALRRGGALADLELRDLEPATMAEEVERLRQAVSGSPGRPGLVAILDAIGPRPHRVLRREELWTAAERARRVDAAGLLRAMRRPANVDEERRPRRVPDLRVEPDVDVYENRLVRAFADEVDDRLRRLEAHCEQRPALASIGVEVEELRTRLRLARRVAPFLSHVRPLAHAPRQLTMVLLRRPPYRAALEGWLALHRSLSLRLREPLLDAPLENTPLLYERWGTLVVVRALLEAALAAGYRVERQDLVRRAYDGLWLEPMPAGVAMLVLRHPADGTRVELTAQRTYGRTGALRSVSFQQCPDVSIRIDPPERPPRLVLFDPKYKLLSESVEHGAQTDEAPPGPGRPRKVDIDKMHAYRDAIRDEAGSRIVEYAAIVFPGETVSFDAGVEAIGAVPGATEGAVSAVVAALAPRLARPPLAVTGSDTAGHRLGSA